MTGLVLLGSCAKKPAEKTVPAGQLDGKKARAIEVMKELDHRLDSKPVNLEGLGPDVLGVSAQSGNGDEAYSTIANADASKPRTVEGRSVAWENDPVITLEGGVLLSAGKFYQDFKDEHGRPCLVVRYTVRKRNQDFQVIIALAQ